VADGFYLEYTFLRRSRALARARTYLVGAVMNIYYVAAIWVGMALLASVVSIRIAVPAALVEIVVHPHLRTGADLRRGSDRRPAARQDHR
jgi:hypothetical protein